MANAKKEKDAPPPMEWRPVYVEYVSVRRCRRNPSFARFAGLPKLHRQFLWTKWSKRQQADPRSADAKQREEAARHASHDLAVQRAAGSTRRSGG